MIVRIKKTPVNDSLHCFEIIDTSFERTYSRVGGLLMMSIVREMEALYQQHPTSFHRNMGRFYAYILRNKMTKCHRDLILGSYCAHRCTRYYFEHYMRAL